MNIRILACVFAAALSMATVGCDDSNTGDAIEDASDSAADSMENMGDKAEDAADEVKDKAEDATD